jgi:hypothetical protein
MKSSLMVMRVSVLGASLLSLAWPARALAGTVTVVTDGLWTVVDGNGMPSLARTVCLNPMNPANCPLGDPTPPMVYGYPSSGWTADLSRLPAGARWIWAPKVTGDSSPAALQTYTFETEFYVCDPVIGGNISVAVDNAAEVSINGIVVSNSMSTSHSTLNTFTVPASSLYGSSAALPPTIRANTLTVRASNAANPDDCASDRYKCNPAGVILGATFEFGGNPGCAGYGGQTVPNGGAEKIADCPAGKTGSGYYRKCVCGAWTPRYDDCATPPVTCTGTDGMTKHGVGGTEPVPCPSSAPNGIASHTCTAQGTWGPPDNSQCRPMSVTCRGNDGNLYSVGQSEALGSCPEPQVGSRSRTCRADGTWSGAVDTCRLPLVCVGAPPGTCICGSRDRGQTGLCPPGVECRALPIGSPDYPSRPPSALTADWYCGALPPAPLGASCSWNGGCTSGRCDSGWGTSNTRKCMPQAGTGNINDWCSNNNQCASGRCGGLRQDLSGAWYPGHCSNTASALGEFCSVNSDCTSTYCDRGDGTSKTSMCMPRGGTGRAGDWCSNHNQCASRTCAGLQGRPDGSWQPGHCN